MMVVILTTAGLIGASSSPSPSWAGSTVPVAGTAEGELIVDGKPLALRHATAVVLPTADERGEAGTEEVFTVFLTPEPLPLPALKGAGDPEAGLVKLQYAVLGLAKAGLVLTFYKDAYQRIIRHPMFKEEDPGLSHTGGQMPQVLGPDRVAGAVSSREGISADEPEDHFGHRVRYRVTFNAPVVHRYAVRRLSVEAKALPAGGGEPGAAYLRDKCIPPSTTDPKDSKLLEPIVAKWLAERGLLPTEKDGQPLARSAAVYEGWMSARMKRPDDLTECTLLGGSSDGEVAVLRVEGLSLGGGGRVRVHAHMAKVAGVWTFKRHVYSPAAP